MSTDTDLQIDDWFNNIFLYTAINCLYNPMSSRAEASLILLILQQPLSPLSYYGLAIKDRGWGAIVSKENHLHCPAAENLLTGNEIMIGVKQQESHPRFGGKGDTTLHLAHPPLLIDKFTQH